MRCFEEVALDLFGQTSPEYELDVEQRRIASFLGKELANSNYLRVGIAETLTLMAARSDIAKFADASTGQDWANRIIFQIFAKVTSWEHWATLDSILVPLAEASPANFLNAVDSVITGEHPIAVNLFKQEDSFWAGPTHTSLLWALELLSWSPDYLGQTALQLAQLTRLDPGGRWANRPKSSLRQIFLILHPCTMAGVAQRLKIIDQIRKHEPDVAWNLMVGIMPQRHTTIMKTHKPDLRDWGTDEENSVTQTEVNSMVQELVARLIKDVGDNQARWSSLMSLFDVLLDEEFNLVADKLEEVAVALIEDESCTEKRASLYNALRGIISRHVAYPDADWSISKAHIERLQEIYTALEPQDLVVRYVWQFCHSGGFMLEDTANWQERHKQIESIRKQSLCEIYDVGGVPDVLRLAHQSKDARLVGVILGTLLSLELQEDNFLSQTLGATEDALVLLG